MHFFGRVLALVHSRKPAAPPRPRWHSVSSTYSYEICPRRSWFGYVERTPEPRSEVPSGWRFGTVVHAGLEAGYKHHRTVGRSRNLAHTIPVAVDAVRASWADEGIPDDARELGRAERVVRASLATTRLWPSEILGVERYFRATTPEGFRVAGAFDLVLRGGPGVVEIRDHKVTRYVRSPDDLVTDFQLNLYGWLVRQTWPWAEKILMSHHYPLLRQVVRVELDAARMEAAIQRVRTVGAVAEADTRFDPTPGEHCATCAYRGVCDASAVAA